MYEFVCGEVPFGEDLTDPYEIYESIISNSLRFTIEVDPISKQLIEILLNKNPSSRICGGYHNLKSNKFFRGFDWVFF